MAHLPMCVHLSTRSRRVSTRPGPSLLDLAAEDVRALRSDPRELGQQPAQSLGVVLGRVGQPAQISLVDLENAHRGLTHGARGALVVADVLRPAKGPDPL